MIIFPAVDIKGGRCVRLLRGDFKKITEYKKSPLNQVQEFFNLGFQNIHLVDLDGALKNKLINENIIKEICKIKKVKIQVGGGVRSLDHIKKLLDFGVNKVIIGTSAVENIEFLKSACNKFNNQIALSLDVRNGYIALSAWKNQTKILATEFIKKVEHENISRIIYTDINKDGTKTGPNIQETLKFSNLTKIPTVISGGVSSIKDITNIKKKNFSNIEGIIIGKAIYDGNINLRELSKII
jgi:phosphoribosylformimino-5-aminoimidazole carboxamide ribotide isomerase|tara:strand:+ start:422 stop:1141 length:720 start_codon:yes stop_codon:yes gene_type:complete